MMLKRRSPVMLPACWIVLCASVFGQSTSVVNGVTYTPEEAQAATPDSSDKTQRVLCYRLVAVTSPDVQPLVIQPIKAPDTSKPLCSLLDETHPLLNRQKLVIAIVVDSSDVLPLLPSIRLLDLNVVPAAASTINLTPVRPSFTPAAQSEKPSKPLPYYYYLHWPNPLTGDTIPTVTVTAVYTFPGTPEGPGGTPPEGPKADQPLTLLNTTLPQVHQLFYFNISTGIIWSSLRNPSFNRIESAVAGPGSPPSPPAQYATVEVHGSPTIDPALFFTVYAWKPMDAERPWHAADLIPEPSAGFSLSSPATDFFFGFSSEIRRNVQLVYGAHMGKINRLSPTIVNDPTSSTAPATDQRFGFGAFAGVTLNIDFIKGLFGK